LGLFRFDLETAGLSTIHELAIQSPWYTRYPTLSNDGNTLYFKDGEDGIDKIFSMNLETKEIRSLNVPDGMRPWALSPDGKMIAMGLRTSGEGDWIEVMSVDGEGRRVIFRYPEGEFQRAWNSVEWTADSRAVIAQRDRADGVTDGVRGDEVWRFPIDGSEPKKLFDTGIVRRFAVHPDGRHLTFEANRRQFDIYVMENFVEVGSTE